MSANKATAAVLHAVPENSNTKGAKLNCPICKTAFQDLGKVPYLQEDLGLHDERLNVFKDLSVSACPDCGFGFTFPELDANALDDFYKGLERETAEVFTLHSPRTMAQVALVRTFKDFSAGDTVLEVGPAFGMLFHAISRVRSDARFFAAEPRVGFHQHLKKMGVTIFPRGFTGAVDSELDAQKYDYVFLSHVLEHMRPEDVLSVLSHVFRVLGEGGAFYCEVPNNDLSDPKHARYAHSPHVGFFTVKSLTKALTEAGFEIAFAATAGPEHSHLMKDLYESAPEANSGRNRLRSFLSRNLALPAREKIRQAVKLLIGEDDFWTPMTHGEFAYGSDRSAIRVVAVKPKSRR